MTTDADSWDIVFWTFIAILFGALLFGGFSWPVLA